MKIGIVTFTYGDNYGQRLQNYAVQELLSQYAEEVVTIPRSRIRYRGIKGLLREKGKRMKNHTLYLYFKRSLAFRKFDKRFIKYNKYQIIDNQLYNEFEFDCFVAGSDQIWSPYSRDVDSSMFLTFTKPEKRIALCPSMAVSSIPDNKRQEYNKYLNGFNALSVREYESADLIKDLCGRDCTVLIDPTLAINQDVWDKLTDESEVSTDFKYIVLYFLGTNQLNDEIQQYADDHSYQIINFFDKKYIACDPCDFVKYIKNAKLVVTDSYHGTIFSIIYHTPFYVIDRKGGKIDMKSRFDTLFRKLHIDQPDSLSASLNIDFATIDKYIMIEKQSFNQYVKSNIQYLK